MHAALMGLSLLLAIAIIGIGIQYLARPRSAVATFGLPLPEEGPNISWWLRLKGVRDIASGLAVLACEAWATPVVVGIVLLALTSIPVGDMLLVLASGGSPKKGVGIHGVTATVMMVTAIPLILGA